MNIAQIKSGDLPNDFNVIIEIPANSSPIKYEIDEASGALVVDRFVGTAMSYPVNYGFIPHTLSPDGDALDVLVITPYPLHYKSVIKCRAIGMLNMTDDAGSDAKILAVPVSKLTPLYDNIKNITDLPKLFLDQIEFFFKNYKGLEKGKWVKDINWTDIEVAKSEIIESANRAKA